MAHEFESGLFVGKDAWHGLGTVLDEAPTTAEALIQAGLDWEVSLQPLTVKDAAGEQAITSHRAVVRESDRAVLGVVGSRWSPLQNRKAFEPFDPLVASGMVSLDAAGSLRGGKRVWILAKLKDAVADVLPGDPLVGYLLFYNGHDGTLSAAYQQTSIRVVCSNTLSAALQGKNPSRYALRHTTGIGSAVDSVTKAFRIAGENFQQNLVMYRFLAGERCPRPAEYFKNVLRTIPDSGRLLLTRLGAGAQDAEEKLLDRNRQHRDLMALLEEQPGAEFGRGSYWHAYNAVTYWIDHERGKNDENRMDSSWFGQGRAIRDRALKIALEQTK